MGNYMKLLCVYKTIYKFINIQILNKEMEYVGMENSPTSFSK